MYKYWNPIIAVPFGETLSRSQLGSQGSLQIELIEKSTTARLKMAAASLKYASFLVATYSHAKAPDKVPAIYECFASEITHPLSVTETPSNTSKSALMIPEFFIHW
jgi:hypothetical protein